MNLVYSMMRVGDHSLSVAATDSDEPTILMLHGVTRRWQTFLPVISALSVRHRPMLVDLRGHGASNHIPSDTYRVVDYVADICQLIHDHVPGHVVLYGHSLGAMTAAGVAAELGEHISAVVMEDPPLHTMGSRIAETPLRNYFQQIARFADSSDSVTRIARELADATFEDPVSGATVRIGDTRDAAQLRFAADSLRRLDPGVFEPILDGEWLDGFDVDRVFHGIRCPGLLLQADYAAGGMLTDADAEHVLSLNNRLSRVQFPGIAHGIHWTSTERLLNAVLPFLESVR